MHESIFTNRTVTAVESLEFEPERLRGPVPEDLLANDPLAMAVGGSTRKDLMVYQVINAAWPTTAMADPDCKDDAAVDMEAVRLLLPQFQFVELIDRDPSTISWRKEGG